MTYTASFFKNTSRALVVSAAMVLGAAAPSSAADQALIDAATAEGKVVWYSTLLANVLARPMKDAFEAKYPGITVDLVSGTQGDIYQKILAEAEAGDIRADVSGGFTSVERLELAGHATPYVPESAKVHGPEGNGNQIVSYFLVSAINSDLVAAEDYPKEPSDLLDPKWQNKIAWSAGAFGGGPNYIGTMLEVMGEEDGMKFLTDLSAQNIINVPANQRVVLDSVVSGENTMAIGMFNHHIPISQSKGAPVDFVDMTPNMEIGHFLKLINGPNTNAGKLLIDFMMSEEGQQIISDSGYIPTHPNVAPKNPALRPDGGGFDVVKITAISRIEQDQKLFKIYEDLFVK